MDFIPSLLLEIQLELSPLLLRDAKLTGYLVHDGSVVEQLERVAEVIIVEILVVDGLVEYVADDRRHVLFAKIRLLT